MDVHSVTASVEPLPQELCKELEALCRGTILFYGDPRLKIMAFYSWRLTKTFFFSFAHHSTVFNGNVVSRAKAAVCPLDAEDVSRFVLCLYRKS